MYVCMYVYIYVYVYICIYIYIYYPASPINIYIYIHTYILICVLIYRRAVLQPPASPPSVSATSVEGLKLLVYAALSY
jgi:hypothetical protein